MGVLGTREVLEKRCLSPTTVAMLTFGLCSKGRAARGPGTRVYPSLEPHLGFLLIFEDDILGPRRRMGKDGIIWKLGVGLHYP